MKTRFFLALIATSLVLGVASCRPNQTPKPGPTPTPNPPAQEEVKGLKGYVDASKYEKWVYYSLKDNKEVEVSDYKNSDAWDIAFHRFDIRLNCGESGKGKGAAVFSGVTEMEKATKVPTEGWVTDAIGTITIKFNMGGGSHDSNHEQTGYNHLITGKKTERGDMSGGWLDHDLGNMPPSVRLSGKVFFVKCADGKIARIQFTDCKDKTGRKNGFISFTYDYNVSVK